MRERNTDLRKLEEPSSSLKDNFSLKKHFGTDGIRGIPEESLTEEIVSKVFIENKERVHKKPYVCIATQSTGQYKYWNNPIGWKKVIDYLKYVVESTVHTITGAKKEEEKKKPNKAKLG